MAYIFILGIIIQNFIVAYLLRFLGEARLHDEMAVLVYALFFLYAIGVVLTLAHWIKIRKTVNRKSTLEHIVIIALLMLSAGSLYLNDKKIISEYNDEFYDAYGESDINANLDLIKCDKSVDQYCLDQYNLEPLYIEEHGKIAVAELDHTRMLVQKYGVENVKISALGYDYISDESYIKRLIGDRFSTVHCIIPVVWPEGELVYIETMQNGEEIYTPFSKQDFDEMISDASDEDKSTLWDNINDDQTYVRQITSRY